MIDLALNSDWDIYLDSNNELALVSNGPEVGQSTGITLQTQKGEYFLDQESGVDYQNIITEIGIKKSIKEREFRSAAGTVEGLKSIRSLTLTEDQTALPPEVDVTLEIDTIYGTTETVTV
jgi:hypothetical protein